MEEIITEMTAAQLRDVALCGNPFSDPESGNSAVPVQENGELAGSIGIAGTGVSPMLLKAIAAKVGSALSEARVDESLKESEISRRADELKSAIYDALAHEARGPLSSINIAATTWLSERPGNAAQQREMLSIIKEEVDRMYQWIDQAARTVRTETRHLKLSTGPQGVRDIVSGAIEPLRHVLQGRQVCMEIQDSIPMADCDAEMTQHVLRLLLDNALKYSPLGTPITIAASLDYGTINVSVSDVGPGVSEDHGIVSFGESGESSGRTLRASVSAARWGCRRVRRESSDQHQVVRNMFGGPGQRAGRRAAGSTVAHGHPRFDPRCDTPDGPLSSGKERIAGPRFRLICNCQENRDPRENQPFNYRLRPS